MSALVIAVSLNSKQEIARHTAERAALRELRHSNAAAPLNICLQLDAIGLPRAPDSSVMDARQGCHAVCKSQRVEFNEGVAFLDVVR
jgi:hypothetical protein